MQLLIGHGQVPTIMPEASNIFKVNYKLYKKVRGPQYKIGGEVEIIEKSLIGQIADVNWHFKDDTPFYYIEIDGKKEKNDTEIVI